MALLAQLLRHHSAKEDVIREFTVGCLLKLLGNIYGF